MNTDSVTNFTLFFDGCSKGNPGKAGAGAVIYQCIDNNLTELWSNYTFLGDSHTNNYAEYMGLIIGLEEAVRMGITNLHVNGDSMLVIKQMQGLYAVKSPNLMKLYKDAKTLAKSIGKITFAHVDRSENKRADALSNEAILMA